MEQYSVKNLKQTKAFVKKFLKGLHGGETLLLHGDLGAGKTTFTQFFAGFLGVKDVVTSPTFNIVKEYSTKNGKKLYHFDMYRLEDISELQEIGAEEILLKNETDFVVVEWPEKIDFPFRNAINIYIEKTAENGRVFRVER